MCIAAVGGDATDCRYAHAGRGCRPLPRVPRRVPHGSARGLASGTTATRSRSQDGLCGRRWETTRSSSATSAGLGAYGTTPATTEGWRNVCRSLIPLPSMARSCGQFLFQQLRGGLVGGAWEVRARSDIGLAVCRGVGLVAPALGERADVVGVVPDRVEELRHRLPGRRVIAGDRERRSLGRTRWALQTAKVAEVDVVERLHHTRLWQVHLK